MDSICINQEDPKEQGAQVHIIGTIYTGSRSTLIYLGDSNPLYAHHAAKLVTEVSHIIERTLEERNHDWESNSFPFPIEGELLGSNRQWQSLSVLLGQPWFRQGWVVQEAALSQNAVLL